MKLSLDKVIFINLCFRAYILIRLLRDDEGPDAVADSGPAQEGPEPASKRVFLVICNGLWEDFLKENSTPFLQEVVDTRGTFGIARTAYLETNYGGLRTIFTGRTSWRLPFFWTENTCAESVLDFVKCKCGTGDIPRSLPLRCSLSNMRPLGKFFVPRNVKKKKSCLYVTIFGLDPVLKSSCRSQLRRTDLELRVFWNAIENLWTDNGTTVIVTSARGSPVGGSLSANAPLVAWGAGIAHSPEVATMKQGDLAALLATLLGTDFPRKFSGELPAGLMDLPELLERKVTLHFIRHFQRVFGIADPDSESADSTGTNQEEPRRKLSKILTKIKTWKSHRWTFIFSLVALSMLLWAANLVAYSASGSVSVFSNCKALTLFLLTVTLTVAHSSRELDLIIAIQSLLYLTYENSKEIRRELCKAGYPCVLVAAGVTAAVAFVEVAGNRAAIPLLFCPVVFWPLFNGSYRRVNPFVLFTRFLTGAVLTLLHFGRTFGELPNVYVVTVTACLFLFIFYALFSVFKRKIDFYVKITSLAIALAIVHVNSLYRFPQPWAPPSFSFVYVAFFLFSVDFAGGTLLERLFKIFLSLLIPVSMMSIGLESVFYVSVVFHIFTWAFIEYHTTNPHDFQFHPSIFSVEFTPPSKSSRFSFSDLRQVLLFVVYCYVSYFAIGNFPDLHSYDLYVIPQFVYRFPVLVSYSLGVLRFFLPFFIVTATFMTLSSLQEKYFNSLLSMSLCLSDLCGCWLIFSNRAFDKSPVSVDKLSCFFIQQFATMSVIASYFLGKHLLLAPDKSFWLFNRPRSQLTEENLP